MKPLQDFYRRSGQVLGKVLGATDVPNFGAQIKPFVHQTPGRHTYYYSENFLHLPDSIKWEIRLPSRWAESEESKKYVPEVEKQILGYMNENVKTNFLDPDRGFDLDLTIREASLLSEASPALHQYAESGELQQVSTAWKTSKAEFEKIREETYNALQAALDKTRADMAAALEGTDIQVGSGLKQSTANVKAYLGKNPGDSKAQQILVTFRDLANKQLGIFLTEKELIDNYLIQFPNSPIEQEAQGPIDA